MNVLVDTSVWSLALRRSAPADPAVGELQRLIDSLQVEIIGPIRQEILSGIRDQGQFQDLRDRLRAFPDRAITTEDYERAAELFNLCRQRGIQGSNTDFLICAVAERHGFSILTTDQDFRRFQTQISIALHEVS